MKRLIVVLLLVVHSAAFAETDWRSFIFPRTTYEAPLFTPIPADWTVEEPNDYDEYDEEEDFYDNYDDSYDEPTSYGYNYPKAGDKYIYPDLVITICDYDRNDELYCYDL